MHKCICGTVFSMGSLLSKFSPLCKTPQKAYEMDGAGCEVCLCIIVFLTLLATSVKFSKRLAIQNVTNKISQSQNERAPSSFFKTRYCDSAHGVQELMPRLFGQLPFQHGHLLRRFSQFLKQVFCTNYSRAMLRSVRTLSSKFLLTSSFKTEKLSLLHPPSCSWRREKRVGADKMNSILKLAGFCIVNISLTCRSTSLGDWAAFLGGQARCCGDSTEE